MDMIHQRHRFTGAIAVALAVVASIAPVAWADPPPLAQAEAAIAANHGQLSTLTRPNPDEQTVIGAPTSAGPCSEVCSGGAGSYGLAGQQAGTRDEFGARLAHHGRPRSAAVGRPSGSGTPATVVRVLSPDTGFDWGDAGIGAGATLILIGIGLGGIRVVTSARAHDVRSEHITAGP
jgi:hypothetical protein